MTKKKLMLLLIIIVIIALAIAAVIFMIQKPENSEVANPVAENTLDTGKVIKVQ